MVRNFFIHQALFPGDGNEVERLGILFMHLALVVCVAILCGGIPFALFEEAVEVAHIVEAGVVADFNHGKAGIDEESGRISEPMVDDIFADGFVGAQAEKAAERRGGHAYEFGQIFKAYFFFEVLMDILHGESDSLTVGRYGRVGKFLAGESVSPVVATERMENAEKQNVAFEAGSHLRHPVEIFLDETDGFLRETDSPLPVSQHLPYGAEGLIGQHGIRDDGGGELDGDLVHLMVLKAVWLCPLVLEARTDKCQVEIVGRFDGVANYAFQPGSADYEIEFHFLVFMERVVEGVLDTFFQMETFCLLVEKGNLGERYGCGFHFRKGNINTFRCKDNTFFS